MKRTPHNLVDRTGKRQGALVVLARAESQGSNAGWLCLCSCGREKVISAASLRHGTKSCGCGLGRAVPKKRTVFSVPEGVSARNRVLKMYRGSARARGLLWALPKKFFFELTQMNCHYCGVPPSTASSNTRGTYLYNGIDRKDSSMGYLKWNVVACCTVCNHAKKDMSYSTFVEWLKRVAQFWRRDA